MEKAWLLCKCAGCDSLANIVVLDVQKLLVYVVCMTSCLFLLQDIQLVINLPKMLVLQFGELSKVYCLLGFAIAYSINKVCFSF